MIEALTTPRPATPTPHNCGSATADGSLLPIRHVESRRQYRVDRRPSVPAGYCSFAVGCRSNPGHPIRADTGGGAIPVL
jgi:hypothetical protein